MIKILKFIILLPFKIIFFPFKMLGNMFSSRKRREFNKTESNIKESINSLKKKTDDKKLSESEKKKIQQEIQNKEKGLKHFKLWKTNEFRSDRDPKNISRFNQAKRHERYFRRSMK
jgi:DNA-binding transcriptional regulator GbsR (MarR family)